MTEYAVRLWLFHWHFTAPIKKALRANHKGVDYPDSGHKKAEAAIKHTSASFWNLARI